MWASTKVVIQKSRAMLNVNRRENSPIVDDARIRMVDNDIFSVRCWVSNSATVSQWVIECEMLSLALKLVVIWSLSLSFWSCMLKAMSLFSMQELWYSLSQWSLFSSLLAALFSSLHFTLSSSTLLQLYFGDSSHCTNASTSLASCGRWKPFDVVFWDYLA